VWNAPVRVLSQHLISGNTNYVTTYAFLDGWGRPRETQSTSPYVPPTGESRIVQVTNYDNRGLVAGTSSPLWNGQAAAGSMLAPSVSAMPSYTATTYDALGRPDTIVLKAMGNGLHGSDNYYYGDAVFTRDYSAYDDASKTFSGALSPTHKTSFDVWGRPTVSEVGGGVTTTATNTYDRAGNLTSIVQETTSGLNPLTWTYGYDWLGRRTSSNDPDSGASTTSYDANGNPTTVTDATGSTAVVTSDATNSYSSTYKVTTTYDDLDRPVDISKVTTTVTTPLPNGTPTPSTTTTRLRSYVYDTVTQGLGLPALAESNDGSATYSDSVTSYDNRGMPTGRGITVPLPGGGTTTFTYGYSYDEADRPRTVSYPAFGTDLSGETVTTNYLGASQNGAYANTTTNEGGVTKTLFAASSGSGASYNAIGMIGSTKIGELAGANPGATTRSYSYDSATLGTTRVMGSRTSGGAYQDDTFTYDTLGNPTKITSLEYNGTGTQTGTHTECYAYDAFQRLTRAWTTTTTQPNPTCTDDGANTKSGQNPYSRRYTYDGYSRITSRNTDGTAYTYAYPAAQASGVHVNAPSTITPAGGTVSDYAYTYDPNGARTTSKNGAPTVDKTLTWDALHQLSSITSAAGTTETYAYGPSGERIYRKLSDGTSVLTLPGTEITFNGSTVTSARRYYTATGKTLGFRTGTAYTWLISDRAGSQDISIDAASGVIRQRRHTPYGDVINNANPAPEFGNRGFLGKYEDATGLDHLGARYYDPAAGLFTSPDPLMDRSASTLSAYLYAGANPVAFSDPSGLAYGSTACSGPDGTSCAQYGNTGGTQGRIDDKRLARIATAERATRDADAAQRAAAEGFDERAFIKDYVTEVRATAVDMVTSPITNTASCIGNPGWSCASAALDIGLTLTGVGKLGKTAIKAGKVARKAWKTRRVERGVEAAEGAGGFGNPIAMAPKSASVRTLTPSTTDGVQEGLEYKWVNPQGQTVRLRIHGPDPSAPVGSNAASGPTYRVQIGGRYADADANLYPRGVSNPKSPFYDPLAADATHIPWPDDIPLPW
jgi:RHS repeat-associated protein